MTGAAGRRASHEVEEHTSELQLRLEAGSLPDLLAEAGRALARLQLGESEEEERNGSWREIEVSASDPAALLVEWLNELIYLAETERWVATEFRFAEADERSLRVRARGVPVASPRGLVKAATLHGLRVAPVPGGYEGEVILDV
jgi:SHS2 domain-containing protein